MLRWQWTSSTMAKGRFNVKAEGVDGIFERRAKASWPVIAKRMSAMWKFETASNLLVWLIFLLISNRALKVWECQECLHSIVNLKRARQLWCQGIHSFLHTLKPLYEWTSLALCRHITWTLQKQHPLCTKSN